MSPAGAATVSGGRYQLDHRLVSGPSADLWRATDLELSRVVAVKMLRPKSARDAAALDRFRASACCTASLAHEGIVRVFDYGEPGSPEGTGRPFLVMEFVDGPSLADRLAGGPVGAALAMDVVAQAAAALDVAHRAGRAHGDIGPQSILLSREGRVKLIGFGAAPRAGGDPGGAAGDLHALGVVAYLCLTGSKPPGDAAAPALPGQIPAPVAVFVRQLTAREPAARIVAAEVARRAAWLRDQLTPASPAAPAGRDVAAVSRAAQPAQLAAADTSLTATMPNTPGSRRRPAATRQRGLFAMPTFAVAALALAAAMLLGVLKPHGGAPQAGGTTKITTVRVAAAGLIGRPVQVVRARLERLGLVVQVRWRPSDRVSRHMVLSVRPAGRVPAHSLITLTGSTRPPGATATVPAAAQAGSPARHRRLSRPAPHGSGGQPPHPAPGPASSPVPSQTPSPSPSPSGGSPPATSPPPSSSPAPSSSPPASGSPSPPA